MRFAPTLEAAIPAAPVAPYLGGKRNLAGRIVRRLAAIEHESYVEPFVGMGGVFLRRPFRAKAEVINDVSREVATLFNPQDSAAGRDPLALGIYTPNGALSAVYAVRQGESSTPTYAGIGKAGGAAYPAPSPPARI